MIVSMKVFCGATCPLLIGISAAVLRSGGMTIRRLLLNGAISVYWPVLVVVNLKILVNPAQLRQRRRRRQRRDSMSAPRRRRSFRSELGGPLVCRVRRRSLARSLGAFTTVVFTDRQPASASQAAAAKDDDDAFLDKLIFICRSSIRSAIFFDRPAFNLDNQVDSIRYITVLCCSMDG